MHWNQQVLSFLCIQISHVVLLQGFQGDSGCTQHCPPDDDRHTGRCVITDALGTTVFSTVTNADSTGADTGAVADLHAICPAAGSFEVTVVAHHIVRLMTYTECCALIDMLDMTIA